jgi:hypothetical protein
MGSSSGMSDTWMWEELNVVLNKRSGAHHSRGSSVTEQVTVHTRATATSRTCNTHAQQRAAEAAARNAALEATRDAERACKGDSKRGECEAEAEAEGGKRHNGEEASNSE